MILSAKHKFANSLRH